MKGLDRLAVFVLLFLVLVPFSTANCVSPGSIEHMVEQACADTNRSTIEPPAGNVFLNGTEVGSVDCSRLDEYSYAPGSCPPVQVSGNNNAALIPLLLLSVPLWAGWRYYRREDEKGYLETALAAAVSPGLVTGLLRQFDPAWSDQLLMSLFGLSFLIPLAIAYRTADKGHGEWKKLLVVVLPALLLSFLTGYLATRSLIVAV